MADKFVTVATFHRSFEAQLAKNLLEEEGIASTLSGELTADMLPFGQAGGSDQIVLQVSESDAQRAAGVLTAVAAAKLDDDWEDEAESGAGVWLCSICGEPVSNRLSMCYSCQTSREGIRASPPRDLTAIQPDLSTLPTGEKVQKRDEIVRTPAPALALPPVSEVDEVESEKVPPTAAGNELARRAFGAAFFGLLTVLLLPISWYYLTKLFFFPGELSPKGMRYLYGALFLNGLLILLVIVLCGSRVIWL
jgi:hypothetical protein